LLPVDHWFVSASIRRAYAMPKTTPAMAAPGAPAGCLTGQEQIVAAGFLLELADQGLAQGMV